MDSNTQQSFQPHQNHPPNTGLLRFRSAPSSLLMSCTDAAAKGSSGDCFETERLISGFINGDDSFSPTFRDFENKSPAAVTEAAAAVSYSNSPRGYPGLPPHYPRQNSVSGSNPVDVSYGSVGSMAMDLPKPVNSISGLARQNSSPAGLFSHFSAQNGFGACNGELSPSTKRLKSQLSLSSRLPSSLGMLSQISEIGDESIDDTTKVPYQFPSWNDPLRFTGMKREQEDDHDTLFSGTQNEGLGGRVRLLSHHLSLPKTSAEMGAVEKLLQYQDSVPCKIRAKRGCATHPRSIAERVRRTRISERMRKLQELVPNMDKQTNTADMLDFAVDYIKDLQRQYETLSDHRANCKCFNLQNTFSNRTV